MRSPNCMPPAGRWYAQNAFIEEALQHLLLGGDTGAAIRLIAEQRYRMMNTTQWPRLERWLNLFTKDVVDTSGELWMVKTWLVYHHGQYAEIPALLTHLDEIMAGEADKGTVNHLAGEIAALHCAVAYYVGDAGRSISFARKSLDLLDHELWIVRVMVRMYLGEVCCCRVMKRVRIRHIIALSKKRRSKTNGLKPLC